VKKIFLSSSSFFLSGCFKEILFTDKSVFTFLPAFVFLTIFISLPTIF
jgi:hypothetical protein